MSVECQPWVDDDPSATIVTSRLAAIASRIRGSTIGGTLLAGQACGSGASAWAAGPAWTASSRAERPKARRTPRLMLGGGPADREAGQLQRGLADAHRNALAVL